MKYYDFRDILKDEPNINTQSFRGRIFAAMLNAIKENGWEVVTSDASEIAFATLDLRDKQARSVKRTHAIIKNKFNDYFYIATTAEGQYFSLITTPANNNIYEFDDFNFIKDDNYVSFSVSGYKENMYPAYFIVGERYIATFFAYPTDTSNIRAFRALGTLEKCGDFNDGTFYLSDAYFHAFINNRLYYGKGGGGAYAIHHHTTNLNALNDAILLLPQPFYASDSDELHSISQNKFFNIRVTANNSYHDKTYKYPVIAPISFFTKADDNMWHLTGWVPFYTPFTKANNGSVISINSKSYFIGFDTAHEIQEKGVINQNYTYTQGALVFNNGAFDLTAGAYDRKIQIEQDYKAKLQNKYNDITGRAGTSDPNTFLLNHSLPLGVDDPNYYASHSALREIPAEQEQPAQEGGLSTWSERQSKDNTINSVTHQEGGLSTWSESQSKDNTIEGSLTQSVMCYLNKSDNDLYLELNGLEALQDKINKQDTRIAHLQGLKAAL